ncbi:MAG: tetratricopeptide repeat protein [Acidobacteria bacterium]|nr:tetratricopeptide repeat protein [Acidobacteriota bacterium]
MTFNFRIGLAGLAALLLVLPAPVRGQEVPENLKGNGTLRGKVVDENGKNVPKPKITLVNPAANASLTVEGKGNGDFEAKNIKSGAWKMVVETPNYVTVRQDVNVAEGKSDKISVVSKNDASPELLEKATALAQAGDLAGARTEYLQVLEAHPELTSINRYVAFTYGREGNTAEALKYLDAALVGTPDDTAMLQLAADSAIKLGQFPKASGYLQKVDYTTLTDSAPFVNMAIQFINGKRQADAIPLLDKLIGRWPDTADLYFFRGYANMGLQKQQEAKPDLEKYLQLAPEGSHAADVKKILQENIK